MVLPDVNVLVHAFRSDSEEHRRCADWLESVVNGDAAYGMSPQVLCSMIRIVTHGNIYKKTSKREEAVRFSTLLLTQPHCHVIQPGPRHWDIFVNLCKRSSANGNLIQDAWLAAMAIEHGCEWISFDTDFAKFPGLTWRRPYEPE